MTPIGEEELIYDPREPSIECFGLELAIRN